MRRFPCGERRGHDEDRDDEHPPGHTRHDAEGVGVDRGEDRARGEEIDEPPHPARDEQRDPGESLQPLCATRRRDGTAEGVGGGLLVGRGNRFRHRRQPRHIIDVGYRELGHPGADPADELGRSKRPTAEVEEVGVGTRDRHSEDCLPLLRQPLLGLVRGVALSRKPCVPRLRSPTAEAAMECRTVHLAGVPWGSLRRARHHPCRETRGDVRGPAAVEFTVALDDEVADQQRHPASLPDRGAAAVTPGRSCSAFSTSLSSTCAHRPSLVVGASDEDEAVLSYRTRSPEWHAPPEGGHRYASPRPSVEVVGEAHPADDEFSLLSRRDPPPSVDHRGPSRRGAGRC